MESGGRMRRNRTMPRPHGGWASLLSVLCATWLLVAAALPAPERPDPPRAAAMSPHPPPLGTLPLAFEPNQGQTDRAVRYLAHGLGGTLYFTPGEVVLVLPAPDPSARPLEAGGRPRQVR